MHIWSALLLAVRRYTNLAAGPLVAGGRPAAFSCLCVGASISKERCLPLPDILCRENARAEAVHAQGSLSPLGKFWHVRRQQGLCPLWSGPKLVGGQRVFAERFQACPVPSTAQEPLPVLLGSGILMSITI